MLPLLLLPLALAKPIDYQIINFYDDPSDCDEKEARFGQCLELTKLLPLAEIPTSLKRGVSTSYSYMWEELAHRWSDQGIVAIMNGAGYPMPAEQWVKTRLDGISFTHPPIDHLLSEPDTFKALYPPVKMLPPSEPETLVRIGGRFVKRLGYDNKPHPYEIMNADRQSSAPFYEQLYPFDPQFDIEANNAPYLKFEAPIFVRSKAERGTPQKPLDLIASAHASATKEFDKTISSISGQIVRYAANEYTKNHMRILGALSLMNVPPEGQLTDNTNHTGRIVAASLGGTDSDDRPAQRLSSRAPERSFAIEVALLPVPVVDKWITKLASRVTLDREALQVIVQFSDINIQPNTPPLPSMEDASLWIYTAIDAKADPNQELIRLKRAYLYYLLTTIKEDIEKTDQRDIQIILDHFSDSLGIALKEKSVPFAPAAMTEETEKKWKSVLGDHGIDPTPYPQNRGLVDPLAICTTKDGQEALAEETIKPIHVDLLLMAPKSLKTVEEVLWHNQDKVPFVMIDNPAKTKPSLTQISKLSSGEILYRVRWTVWSGWHLLWDFDISEGPEMKLIGKTSAFCDDMLLTTAEIAPALVRASLLENFLPTTPASIPTILKAQKEKLLNPEEEKNKDEETPLMEIKRTTLQPLHQKATDENYLLFVIESDPTSHLGIMKDRSFPTPYQRTVSNRIWHNSWVRMMSPEKSLLALPKRSPLQSAESTTLLTQWAASSTTDWLVDFGGGISPLHEENENGDSTQIDTINATEWGTLEIGTTRVQWLSTAPRKGWDLSLKMLLDFNPTRLFASNYTFTEKFGLQGEFMAGYRVMPAPNLTSKRLNVWGPASMQSKPHLSRTQYGIRGGILFGNGFERIPIMLCTEAWWAFSANVGIRANKSILPYRPNLLLSPYLRAEVGFDHTNQAPYRGYSVSAGFRSHLRLNAEPKQMKKLIEQNVPTPE